MADNNSESENKIKSIAILVESLKLYVTLSVISIAGLITYYSRVNVQSSIHFFYIGLILLLFSAIASIFNINYFVTKVYKNQIDIFTKTARSINLSAMIFFILGILSSGFFISSNINMGKQNEKISIDSGIVIENKKITIANDVKTKVSIIKDSTDRIIEIKINP